MTDDSLWQDPVIQHMISWTEARASVRAVLLTSTRAQPGAPVADAFSDYDVMLAVTDIQPYFEDRNWLGDFGSVLVVYRDPIHIEYGCGVFAYITQYIEDRLKIDFTVMQADWLRGVAETGTLPDVLDVGYRVLLDKDNLTVGLPAPTYQAHIPTPPTEDAYLELIELLFHEATYVAKHLWRGDLIAAKFNLDAMMKAEDLRKLLEWRIEIDHGWTLRPGAYGKRLQQYVEADTWAALARTYVGLGVEENWNALFATIDLFRQVAITVGEHLGYAYPHAMDQRAVAYLRGVQALDHD